MPTNANTFNSRVTSESLEAKFRQVFPAQGGAELVQDLFASGVIQPVVDFSSVAEGSILPENLQTAWGFATDLNTVRNGTTTLANTPGFWKVDLNAVSLLNVTNRFGKIYINSGVTTKDIWRFGAQIGTTTVGVSTEDTFVVYLRSGDSLVCQSNDTDTTINVWIRQIADVNGTLVNPLGFTFQ